MDSFYIFYIIGTLFLVFNEFVGCYVVSGGCTLCNKTYSKKGKDKAESIYVGVVVVVVVVRWSCWYKKREERGLTF